MKYALITGGSRGIGRAVSVKMASLGYHVLINYAGNTEAAEETLRMVREAGSDGTLMKFDVSDAVASRKAIEEWQAAHEDEYIEVLFNNAGIRRDNVMALMPREDWNRVLTITLDGFYNVTQPLLAPMQFHKFGRIINMASVSGIKGLPGQTNYSAAKLFCGKRRNYRCHKGFGSGSCQEECDRKRHSPRFHQDGYGGRLG